MRYDYINYEMVPVTNMKASVLNLLESFTESGIECARIIGYAHKNAESCVNSINMCVRMYRIKTARGVCRKGNVYIVKVSV